MSLLADFKVRKATEVAAKAFLQKARLEKLIQKVIVGRRRGCRRGRECKFEIV